MGKGGETEGGRGGWTTGEVQKGKEGQGGSVGRVALGGRGGGRGPWDIRGAQDWAWVRMSRQKGMNNGEEERSGGREV